MRRHGRKLGALPTFPDLTITSRVAKSPAGNPDTLLVEAFTANQHEAGYVTALGGGEYAVVMLANTSPKYRGVGLYPVMLTMLRDLAKKQGYKGIVSEGEGRIDAKSTTAWEKFAAREPRVRRRDSDFFLEGLGALTSNADLDKFRFTFRKKQDGVKLSVYDGKKLIGVVGAITAGNCYLDSEAALAKYRKPANVVSAEILPEYRGKKLYQEMLLRLREYAKKELGCAGIKSDGFQRSSMASRAWKKLNPRVEVRDAFGREDLFLDGLGKALDPAEGYRIEVEEKSNVSYYETDPKRRHYKGYVARAFDKNGTLVGSVDFGPTMRERGLPNEVSLEAGLVSVKPEHQRKGIATAMYQAVQQTTGRRIIPSVSRTEEGKALWEGSGGKHFGALPTRGRIPLDTVKRAMKRLPKNRRACGFTPAELREGMEIEREHRDVTGGRVGTTAKIAAAHLCERRDYYRRLKRFVER